MTPPADPAQRLRYGVYGILIALAAGDMAGRLLAVNAVSRMELEQHLISQRVAAAERQFRAEGVSEEALRAKLRAARHAIEKEERRQRPFLSGNDRSRWLTVRALVEKGTFEIDELIDRHVWNTIDMVRHRGSDGELHLYSSKPPLLVVVVAAQYWLIHQLTGWTLAENPYEVGRTILFTVNVLPMLGMIAIVARFAERLGATDWGRVFVVAAASLGTMLTPFAVVLNNHLPGAVSAAVAFDAIFRIYVEGERRVRWYAVAGAASAFAAACELPALALLAMATAALMWHSWRQWLLGFVPAAGLVVVAFFATNYVAHGSLRPPYMHRSETDPEDNWYAYSYNVGGVERQSYWLDPQGIDRGEPSKATYAIHSLVGHHGVFSLTPVWLLSVWGAWLGVRRGDVRVRQLLAGIVVLSVVCMAFYIGLRPQEDRNYGGMTSGFRWLFWLAPLWLVAMLPAADQMVRTRFRMAVALLLLASSALSASYPTWNPWTQPWIYNWMQASGWTLF
jgi:hypothetical protein